MPDPSNNWAVVRRVLGEALDLPESERAAFLDRACEGDPSLRADVQSLLDASANDSLDPDSGDAAKEMLDEMSGPLEPGDMVGKYTVQRLLGAGGMGVVYEAQDRQLGRSVAIKLLVAFAMRTVSARFQQEARLLARLDHPGVARVYDSGVHRLISGRTAPYYVMEVVAGGRTLTQFAEASGLSTRDRLMLFCRVCDAVAHGHANGIIHRDLKPANILVGTDGHPKVIDFGIARAVERTSGQADFTATMTSAGQVVGTLRYMSPETIERGSGAADARGDVYALGVTLYELLVGRAPYELDDSSILQSVLAIEERRPLRLGNGRADLRGDLEVIALKAVEKDPAVRYQTVAEFSADIRRFLADEPITARPPGVWHEIRLFARRRRGLMAGLIAAAGAITIGAAVAGVGLVRASRAETRAVRVAEFLKRTLQTADPNVLPAESLGLIDVQSAPIEAWIMPDPSWGSAVPPGRDASVRDVLAKAGEHLEEEFGNQPLLHADAAFWIGASLASMDDPRCYPFLHRCWTLRFKELGADDPTTLQAALAFDLAARIQGVQPSVNSVAFLEDLVGSCERAFGEFDARTQLAAKRLSWLLASQGDAARAIELSESRVARATEVHGADTAQTLRAESNLIHTLCESGRGADAWKLSLDVLPRIEARFGRVSPLWIEAASPLVDTVALEPALLPDVIKLGREWVEAVDTFHGQSSACADARNALVRALLRVPLLDEAYTHASIAESCSGRYRPNSLLDAKTKATLARVLLWQRKDPARIKSLADAAFAASRALAPTSAGNDDFTLYFGFLGDASVRLTGNAAEAERLVRERIGRAQAAGVISAHWVRSLVHLELAECLADQRRWDEATAELDLALAVFNEGSPYDPGYPIGVQIREAIPRIQARAKADTEAMDQARLPR